MTITKLKIYCEAEKTKAYKKWQAKKDDDFWRDYFHSRMETMEEMIEKMEEK